MKPKALAKLNLAEAQLHPDVSNLAHMLMYAHPHSAVNRDMRERIGEFVPRHLTAAMSSVIAQNIRMLRESLNEEQAEFGERFDASQSTVSRWEDERKPQTPRPHTLIALAKLASTTPEEFSTNLISLKAPAEAVGVAPAPMSISIMMPVQMPSADDLTRMFLGLLNTVGPATDRAEAARRLAVLLPGALEQAIYRSTANRGAEDASTAPGAGAHTHATEHPAPRP